MFDATTSKKQGELTADQAGDYLLECRSKVIGWDVYSESTKKNITVSDIDQLLITKQTRVDEKSVENYTLHYGAWSNCTGTTEFNQGQRFRVATCQDGSGDTVESRFCSHLKKRALSVTCYLAVTTNDTDKLNLQKQDETLDSQLKVSISFGYNFTQGDAVDETQEAAIDHKFDLTRYGLSFNYPIDTTTNSRIKKNQFGLQFGFYQHDLLLQVGNQIARIGQYGFFQLGTYYGYKNHYVNFNYYYFAGNNENNDNYQFTIEPYFEIFYAYNYAFLDSYFFNFLLGYNTSTISRNFFYGGNLGYTF